jgi:mono/diheme cytochrome c family protein
LKRGVPEFVLLACGALGLALAWHGIAGAKDAILKPSAAPSKAPGGAVPRHWGVIDRYCVDCHNTQDWAGGVAFDALDPANVSDDAEVWEKAVRKLRTGMMPPAGKPRPERAVLDDFASELATRIDAAGTLHPRPGAKSLHRLNRTEYANAIRDILAFHVEVSSLLPADDAAEGFDNIADVLGVSPTLIQSYISAAMKISRAAVGDRSMAPTLVRYSAPPGLSQQEHIEGLPLGTRGGMRFTHNFPLDAQYEVRVSAGAGFRFAGPAGGPEPLLDITLNGEPVKVKDPRKFRLRVQAGPQTIGIALVEQRRWVGVDDLYAKSQPRRDDFENAVINGPFDATGAGDTPSRRAIFICQPADSTGEEDCARRIFAHLAGKAFRRPVKTDEAEVETLMQFYLAGRKTGDFDSGIQKGLARLLADPQFLYRMESGRTDLADGAIYRISDLELASRLSFFLWSSVPDDALIQAASAQRLSEPRVLEQQVRRMLADPRSNALVENFAGQWLHLRELRSAQPADREFDENLREAFRQETELFFGSVMREDRSLVDLLDADYTFLNERLARHYGIPGVHGTYMRRVSLPKDSPRRGLLGQGSILTVTSVGDRTSPVIRGAWVMENLMGAPVPRPPPGVETNLKATADASAPTTLRARLERHRADPTCAACHQIMDPIGFSLEHFDLVGRWRDRDGSIPVDASGKLVDGTPLAGVQDLRHALLARSDSFVTSATEKLLMYALGRRIEPFDQPAIRRIVHDAGRENYRFSALVLGIVKSAPFQLRAKQPDGAEAVPASLRQASVGAQDHDEKRKQ